MDHLLSELFKDIHSAEKAYWVVLDLGYKPEKINLIMSEKTRAQYHGQGHTVSIETSHTAAKNIVKGTAFGGAVGASFGVLTAIGVGIIAPELGVVIAGPIILSCLASAGAGALYFSF